MQRNTTRKEGVCTGVRCTRRYVGCMSGERTEEAQRGVHGFHGESKGDRVRFKAEQLSVGESCAPLYPELPCRTQLQEQRNTRISTELSNGTHVSSTTTSSSSSRSHLSKSSDVLPRFVEALFCIQGPFFLSRRNYSLCNLFSIPNISSLSHIRNRLRYINSAPIVFVLLYTLHSEPHTLPPSPPAYHCS